jgi:hypothetical protein
LNGECLQLIHGRKGQNPSYGHVRPTSHNWNLPVCL